MDGFKYHCNACDARQHCEYTFGEHYADKSSNGAGCNHKIRAFDLGRVKRIESSYPRPIAPQARQVDTSGTWHKYAVTHKSREYETAARTEAEAVNSVRFRLYGRTPDDECGRFTARIVESGFDVGKPREKPSKADILERLNRMRRN